jgi:hypothetical protein
MQGAPIPYEQIGLPLFVAAECVNFCLWLGFHLQMKGRDPKRTWFAALRAFLIDPCKDIPFRITGPLGGDASCFCWLISYDWSVFTLDLSSPSVSFLVLPFFCGDVQEPLVPFLVCRYLCVGSSFRLLWTFCPFLIYFSYFEKNKRLMRYLAMCLCIPPPTFFCSLYGPYCIKGVSFSVPWITGI